MKESYWGYWIVLLGIFIMGVMFLVNRTTTGTTQDYYALKEVTQASMVDAVDYSYYRLYGDIKMSKSKFIENFIRRFAETTTIAKNYDVSFYDIYEVPPKVSVMVSSNTGTVGVANDSANFDLVNKLDVILIGGVDGTEASKTNTDFNTCVLSIDVGLFHNLLRTSGICSLDDYKDKKICSLKDVDSNNLTERMFIDAIDDDYYRLFSSSTTTMEKLREDRLLASALSTGAIYRVY